MLSLKYLHIIILVAAFFFASYSLYKKGVIKLLPPKAKDIEKELPDYKSLYCYYPNKLSINPGLHSLGLIFEAVIDNRNYDELIFER